jgi:hypothetical protein
MLQATAAGFTMKYCEIEITLLGTSEISAMLDLMSVATFSCLQQGVQGI